MMAVIIQEKVTIANPSRFVIDLFFLVKNQQGNPSDIHIIDEFIKPWESYCPEPKEISNGITIVNPSIVDKAPKILKRLFTFIKETSF